MAYQLRHKAVLSVERSLKGRLCLHIYILFAVVEFGVIYVICIDDYIHKKYNQIADSLLHFALLGLGLMVGGSAMDHQRKKPKYKQRNWMLYDLSERISCCIEEV